MTKKLLPCPFCGDDEELIIKYYEDSKSYSVICEFCGGAGPEERSEQKACASWNERVWSDKIEAFIDSVKQGAT